MNRKVPSMNAAFQGVAEQKRKVAHFLIGSAIVLFIVSLFLPKIWGFVTLTLAIFFIATSVQMLNKAQKLKEVVERREKNREQY